MTVHLLDANVLIALTVAEHEHHERAASWMATIDRFAVAPLIEGALVRFLVRIGESPRAAAQLLRAVHTVRGFEFWNDDLSYGAVPLEHVTGHRQVTDAYLLALTNAHAEGRLATLDEGLAALAPDVTALLPATGFS